MTNGNGSSSWLSGSGNWKLREWQINSFLVSVTFSHVLFTNIDISTTSQNITFVYLNGVFSSRVTGEL